MSGNVTTATTINTVINAINKVIGIESIDELHEISRLQFTAELFDSAHTTTNLYGGKFGGYLITQYPNNHVAVMISIKSTPYIRNIQLSIENGEIKDFTLFFKYDSTAPEPVKTWSLYLTPRD